MMHSVLTGNDDLQAGAGLVVSHAEWTQGSSIFVAELEGPDLNTTIRNMQQGAPTPLIDNLPRKEQEEAYLLRLTTRSSPPVLVLRVLALNSESAPARRARSAFPGNIWYRAFQVHRQKMHRRYQRLCAQASREQQRFVRDVPRELHFVCGPCRGRLLVLYHYVTTFSFMLAKASG